MARFEAAMSFVREVESEPVPTLKTPPKSRKSTKSKKQGQYQNQNRHPNDDRMDDDYRLNTPREYVRNQSEKEARVAAAGRRYTRDDSAMKKDFAVGTDR